jgi:deazaflavin-dependent oxidoreductase (nitroreductase family)
MSVNEYNQTIIEDFRANNGSVGGRLAGIPLLLLNTTGAKTGLPRTTPLGYWTVDGRIVVIASVMGAPKHPAWYHNLVANPEVTVELGGERFPARAIPLTGEDWDRAHAEVTRQSPAVGDHHARTTRKIPYVALERQRR